MVDDLEHTLERILDSWRAPEDSARLGAARSLEETLKGELEAGRTDWAGLVSRLLPALIRGIGDPHKGVQVHSASCLQFLACQSTEVIPALREAMGGSDRRRAWGAAIVFARMGLWAPEVGPALSGALGADDRDVRWAAAGLALQLGRSHPEAVAMVKESLAAGGPMARKMAAYCLGAMGAYAPVEEALAARLNDPDRDVRRAVILAIDKLPQVSEAVRDLIGTMAQDPDLYVRRTAIAVAGKR